MILFSLLNIFSLVRGLMTAKYLQIEAIVDRIELRLLQLANSNEGSTVFACKQANNWSQLFTHQ